MNLFGITPCIFILFLLHTVKSNSFCVNTFLFCFSYKKCWCRSSLNCQLAPTGILTYTGIRRFLEWYLHHHLMEKLEFIILRCALLCFCKDLFCKAVLVFCSKCCQKRNYENVGHWWSVVLLKSTYCFLNANNVEELYGHNQLIVFAACIFLVNIFV